METVSPAYLRLGMKKKHHLCNQRLSALMVELMQVRVIMPVLFSAQRLFNKKNLFLEKFGIVCLILRNLHLFQHQ